MEQLKDHKTKPVQKLPTYTSKLKASSRPKQRFETQLSTKSILNITSLALKPQTAVTSPTESTLSLNRGCKSEQSLILKGVKKIQAKSPYQMAIKELKLPTTSSVVINSVQCLPQWMKNEIRTYSEIFYLPKTETLFNPANDETDGEFRVEIGDAIEYKLEVVDWLGKGTFGQVLKVLDHESKRLFALKIIKNAQRYYEQSLIEIEILKFLKEKQLDQKANTVSFECNFIFRNHMVTSIQCICFELLSDNLYESIKKNNFRGLAVPTIKKISYQTLKCLSFLSNYGIIHCDLKPENILMSSPTSNSVKIIDFGSSCFTSQKIYSYIQSRFYRAPEVVLGIPYTSAIDIWSFGCIMVELYTGLPIFSAENEKELISCIAEVLGEPSSGLLARGSRVSIYFSPDGKLKPYKNSRGRRRMPATRPLKTILKGADEEFVSLVGECLRWDPNERVSAEIALKSAWLVEALASPKVTTRYCKISMGDIIKHTPKLKNLMTHRIKPSMA